MRPLLKNLSIAEHHAASLRDKGFPHARVVPRIVEGELFHEVRVDQPHDVMRDYERLCLEAGKGAV